MLEVVCIARWNSLMTSWIVFFITENSSVVVAFVCIPFCGFGRVGCQVGLQTQIIFLSSSRKMMLSWRTQFRQQHGASYSPSRTAFLSQRSLGWKVGSRWQHQHSANPMTAGMRKKRGNHSNSHSDYILTMNCSVWRGWTGETWRCLPLLSQTPLPLPVPPPRDACATRLQCSLMMQHNGGAWQLWRRWRRCRATEREARVASTSLRKASVCSPFVVWLCLFYSLLIYLLC